MNANWILALMLCCKKIIKVDSDEVRVLTVTLTLGIRLTLVVNLVRGSHNSNFCLLLFLGIPGLSTTWRRLLWFWNNIKVTFIVQCLQILKVCSDILFSESLPSKIPTI